MDLDVLISILSSEEHVLRSLTPKIFCLMTQTTILAFKSVIFGRKKVMAHLFLSLSLSLSLWRWKTTHQK